MAKLAFPSSAFSQLASGERDVSMQEPKAELTLERKTKVSQYVDMPLLHNVSEAAKPEIRKERRDELTTCTRPYTQKDEDDWLTLWGRDLYRTNNQQHVSEPEIKQQEPMTVGDGEYREEDGIDDESVVVTELQNSLKTRSNWIPMRLTADERELLAILEGALEVSEYALSFRGANTRRYTDKVDVHRYNRRDAMQSGIMEVLRTILGLYVAQRIKEGASEVLSEGIEVQADSGITYQ